MRRVSCFSALRTILLLGSFCVAAYAGQFMKGPYEVGRRWVYRHEGPRPGSAEPNAIDGERILHVIGALEEQGRRHWVIEERFTNDPNVFGRLYVDETRTLTALDIENDKGEVATLYYDPPAPYQIAEIEVGQTKTIETMLRARSEKFALPVAIAIERLADEAITTPAGEFAGCLHYKIHTRSTIDVKVAKVPIAEKRERWYHAEVNGLVKEVYRREPVKFLMWSQDGYTATSVLTAFDTAPVDVRSTFSPAVAGGDVAPQAGNPRSSPFSSIAVPVLVLAAVVVAGYVGIARSRARRAV